MSTDSARHTPQGHRIDVETGDKFLKLRNGEELRGDATQCEIELWQIRDQMLSALKAAEIQLVNCVPVGELHQPNALQLVRAAISKAEVKP